MKLNTTFQGLAKRFAVDFEELARQIDHAPTSGAARENALISLLQTYLRSRVGVH